METRADAIAKLHTPLGKGDWLMLQMEVPLEENWRALKAARAAGARTVLNLAPAMPIDDAILADLDALIVNQPEAQFIGDRLGLSPQTTHWTSHAHWPSASPSLASQP